MSAPINRVQQRHYASWSRSSLDACLGRLWSVQPGGTMCGIAGITGSRAACSALSQMLVRMHDLGHDSAGVALANAGQLAVRKQVGTPARLAATLADAPLAGTCGIGHARWSTVGAVTQANAHPHLSADGRIAVVAAGDIENVATLRAALLARGARFLGDTDSEVIPLLIAEALCGPGAPVDPADGDRLADAVRSTARQLRGGFAFAVIGDAWPDRLVLVRHGRPLWVGMRPSAHPGRAAVAFASAPWAMRGHATWACRLPEDSMADITAAGVRMTTVAGRPLHPRLLPLALAAAQDGLSGMRQRLRQALRSGPGGGGREVEGATARMACAPAARSAHGGLDARGQAPAHTETHGPDQDP